MNFFSVLTMLGGLALFLYGMDSMGEGLSKLSGGKLESILEKLTANKFKGFMLGFIVTAIIQSSSATTVMLVGFVNSGIMRLGQTISIILGANIGTTVTAWILSLTGLSGDNFFIRLLKPETFTPVIAAVGVVMIMFAKSGKKKDIGSILVGFSILMFGMETMSGAVKGLKDQEWFCDMLVMFSNPVLGILSGTILTALIQSSSASVGILQALSMSGAIPFSTAIPIIFGQNIGTTITPILSSISGNTDSKRVAFACLYIKIIGVVVISVIFYVANAFFNFAFMNYSINVLEIAVVHTLFNILSTIIIMPFTDAIEKFTHITIKGKQSDIDKKYSSLEMLDERFLNIPTYAIDKCRELVIRMARLAQKSIEDAVMLTKLYDADAAEKVRETENKVDRYEDKLGAYLVKLSGKNLTDADSKKVTMLLHVIGDVERISDHSVNIVDTAEEIHKKKISFSPEGTKEINKITAAVLEVLALTVDSLAESDMEKAREIEPLEQVIDKLRHRSKNNHIARLKSGDCTIELGFVFNDLLANLERVSDHCSNIGVSILQSSDSSIEMHDYLGHIKNDGDIEFLNKYDEFKRKYSF